MGIKIGINLQCLHSSFASERRIDGRKKEYGICKILVCEKKCKKNVRKIFVIEKFLLHLHSWNIKIACSSLVG